jgi:molecular chaperone GrpE
MSKKETSHSDPIIPDFVKSDMNTSATTKTESLGHSSYEELEEALNDATASMEDYKSQVMRLHAEMDNLRKRSEKDIANAHKYSLDRFVTELLPIIDSLEHGLGINVGDNEFAKNVHDGLKMTLDLFLCTLEKFAVKPVNPINEMFTPDLHQAISMEQNTEVAANTVLKVLQKGYTLNDRLIRPALVIVAKP